MYLSLSLFVGVIHQSVMETVMGTGEVYQSWLQHYHRLIIPDNSLNADTQHNQPALYNIHKSIVTSVFRSVLNLRHIYCLN